MGDEKEEIYKIKESVIIATAKALIVPFNILGTLIAYGALLDTGEFSKESQDLTYSVLTGYGILVLSFATVTTAVILNAYFKKYKKETAGQIFWFIIQFGLAITASVAYFVGDNVNNSHTNDDIEKRDLTVLSIISLIGAKLGFNAIPYITKCGKSSINTLRQMCPSKSYSLSENPESCENCRYKKENEPNPVKFAESLFYAVILTIAIIPEVDTTFTILYNLISLTTDTCRTRKYNTLWVLYGGIILIAILETVYGISQAFNIYLKSKKETLAARGWLCSISLIIVAVFAVIINGLVFVADNELPLDCSQHFNIATHTRRNYKLRVAFLTVSLGLLLIMFFIQLSCWIYFLYQYCQNSNSRAPTESIQMEGKGSNESKEKTKTTRT